MYKLHLMHTSRMYLITKTTDLLGRICCFEIQNTSHMYAKTCPANIAAWTAFKVRTLNCIARKTSVPPTDLTINGADVAYGSTARNA